MLYKLHYELLEKIHSSWNRIRISPYPQILSTFDPLSVCIRKKNLQIWVRRQTRLQSAHLWYSYNYSNRCS